MSWNLAPHQRFSNEMAFNHHLEAKNKGCEIRVNQCTIGQKGIKPPNVMETQRGNNGTIRSLKNNKSNLVNKYKMCKAFQEIFTLLSGEAAGQNVGGISQTSSLA